MSIHKTIYLTDSHIGHVTCKKCGDVKAFNVDGMDLSRDYNVTCKKCNRSFPVRFEARRYYRKKTNLQGVFAAKEDLRGSVKIADISMTGIGFMTNFEYPEILKGMHVKLSFKLDNLKKAAINLGGEVINRKGKFVGMRITDMEEHIKNDIGFYLTPSI